MKQIGVWLQRIAALLIFIAGIVSVLLYTTDNPRYHLILDEKNMLLEGMVATLWISVVTLLLSMVFGFLFYLMMKSKIIFIQATAVIFNEIIMGTPLLVMVFIVVYVLGNLIGFSNKLVLGVIALTMYTCPYMANSYASAAAVIDEDQYTVMKLYHFNSFQKYRYVMLPQMIRPLVPALLNHLSSSIKGSALLRIVSISELSYVITVISSKTWASIEGYLVMWIAYLIITIPLSVLAQYIGKKLNT